MKKIAMVVIAILALMSAVIPAFAGMGPSWYVAASSGLYSEWGQELVSGSLFTADSSETEQFESFDPDPALTTWTAIQYDNQLYYRIMGPTAPTTLTGKIWSGANEARDFYKVTFVIGGDIWGSRELTVRKDSDNFPVILNEPVSSGYYKTFWFSSAERGYTYKLATVPEPASLLALGTGFIGLGGFSLRRRK